MATQSEILGFDTSMYKSNVGKQTNFFDSVSNIGQGILKVFDNGIDIFASVAGRVNALNQAYAEAFPEDEETVNPSTAQDTNQTNALIKNAIIAVSLGVGAIIIYKMVK